MGDVPPGSGQLGAIVVIEHGAGIVMVLPPGGPSGAPASLPGGFAEPRETHEDAAVRLALEQTGLEIALGAEITRFVQEGTPIGTVEVAAYVAAPTGGSLRGDGPEGPAAVYPLDSLPRIIPIRAANQRVLDAYLGGRGPFEPDADSARR